MSQIRLTTESSRVPKRNAKRATADSRAKIAVLWRPLVNVASIGAAHCEQIQTAELINIRINESRQSFEPKNQEGDDDASDR
jgi:hypothetical protein